MKALKGEKKPASAAIRTTSRLWPGVNTLYGGSGAGAGDGTPMSRRTQPLSDEGRRSVSGDLAPFSDAPIIEF